MATFGDNLRKLREARGLSQEELAKRLDHKRPSTVQSWESDRRKPRPASIRKLAKALQECTPADLLDGVPSDYEVLRGATHEPQEAPASTTIPGSFAKRVFVSFDSGDRDVAAKITKLTAQIAAAVTGDDRVEEVLRAWIFLTDEDRDLVIGGVREYLKKKSGAIQDPPVAEIVSTDAPRRRAGDRVRQDRV